MSGALTGFSSVRSLREDGLENGEALWGLPEVVEFKILGKLLHNSCLEVFFHCLLYIKPCKVSNYYQENATKVLKKF